MLVIRLKQIDSRISYLYRAINKYINLRLNVYSTTMNENNYMKLDDDTRVIKEGKAEILEPPDRKVFYNPVQEFNRDISILGLTVFGKELAAKKSSTGDGEDSDGSLRILEALSATGLRSIRYAKEIPNVKLVVANDISEYAIKNIERNIAHNKLENVVQPSHSDAVSVMHAYSNPSKRFHVVDLDPYGSPTIFLDSAVQSVADGGMLLVTCTDMAILCGNFPETCYVKYGAISLKCPAHHEMAIRIVLQCIQSHASRYKRYIVPQLSISVDFYVRVFVRVYTGASACKNVTSKLSHVFHCTGCDTLTLQPLGVTKKAKDGKNVKHVLPHAPGVDTKCAHCGGNHHMGGPIWSGPLHDESFVSEMLQSEKINELGTSKRLTGMLSVIREELEVPLYYNTAKLSCVMKSSTVPIITMRSAILNGNYRVSFSHADKQSVKTDAPAAFIWDIMRQWVKENPINMSKIDENSAVHRILSKPVTHQVDFSLRPDANPLSRELKLTRFQENPMPNWGPGSKSKTIFLEENPKRAKNQNKKRYKKRRTNSNNSSNDVEVNDPSQNDH